MKLKCQAVKFDDTICNKRADYIIAETTEQLYDKEYCKAHAICYEHANAGPEHPDTRFETLFNPLIGQCKRYPCRKRI